MAFAFRFRSEREAIAERKRAESLAKDAEKVRCDEALRLKQYNRIYHVDKLCLLHTTFQDKIHSEAQERLEKELRFSFNFDADSSASGI